LKKVIVLFLALFLISPEPASAQRRKRSSSRARSSKAAPPAFDPTLLNQRREGATKVATQIKSLSRFLYLFGGVVKTIEATDKAIQGEQVSPQAVSQAETNKASVKESIRNVRAGLEQIEADMSGKPGLRPYYHRFVGVSELAATAEQQAQANQFDQAGRTLLRVVEKLSDGLAAMQQATTP